jgi:hypothetical protein
MSKALTIASVCALALASVCALALAIIAYAPGPAITILGLIVIAGFLVITDKA